MPPLAEMATTLRTAAELEPVPYVVRNRKAETHDVVTLAVSPAQGDLPAWKPGQFCMLWAPGIGEIPVSISAQARRGDGLRFTIRTVGAVSSALARSGRGATIGVRGPFGTDWGGDALAGRDVVIIGGGIGLAPLRGAIRRLAGHARQLHVLVGARSPGDLIFTDEMTHWAEHPATTVAVAVDHAAPEWKGHVGVVTELLGDIPLGPETVALLCGPEVMIRIAADALVERGVPAPSIRVSLERNMSCGVGHCGHCQLGPMLVCCQGPVVTWDGAEPFLRVREL